MASDYEIFEGKSLSGLFKDIYENTKTNKTQLEVLMKEVVGFIKDGDTAVQIIPMLKEYLEINVKNDDQLVKVAAIVQRIIAAENKGGSEEEFGLSEAEKEQLMGAIEDAATDLQSHSDEIEEDMNLSYNEIKKNKKDKNVRKQRQELSKSASRGLSRNNVQIVLSFD